MGNGFEVFLGFDFFVVVGSEVCFCFVLVLVGFLPRKSYIFLISV